VFVLIVHSKPSNVQSSVDERFSNSGMWAIGPERAERRDVGYAVAWTKRKTLTMQHGLAGPVNAGREP
jgi:hypothetical protein